MSFDRKAPLVLGPGVLIFSARDLTDDVRARVPCSDDDFLISKRSSSVPSTVIDRWSAELLRPFEQRLTAEAAAALFAESHGVDPEEALSRTQPLLEKLLANGCLVAADSDESEPPLRLSPGQRVAGFSVLRAMIRTAEVELYRVRDDHWTPAVLKIATSGSSRTAASLRRERSILNQLEPKVAPRLLGAGEYEGRPFLQLEWCPGLPVDRVVREWRSTPAKDPSSQLLELCQTILDTYRRLHEHGFVHGDVHGDNILVDSDGTVRLVDFGLARNLSQPPDEENSPPRGGVGFYYDPELADALLRHQPPPPGTESSEQYSIAALLYELLTGKPYLEFSFARLELLRQIVREQPLSFAQRGCPPHPELEAILMRALSKDPAGRYPSLTGFARAFLSIRTPTKEPSPSNGAGVLERTLERFLEQTAEGGEWLSIPPNPPTGSMNLGAAGVALALLHIAVSRSSPGAMHLADLWACRAATAIDTEAGVYNQSMGLGREELGATSPFHTESGVFAVQAKIARAMDDRRELAASVRRFVDASRKPCTGIDLTLGRAGTLLVSALLCDLYAGPATHAAAEPAEGSGTMVPSSLDQLGSEIFDDLSVSLEQLPDSSAPSLQYLGVAHGWAGVVYAVLQWSRARKIDVPGAALARLDDLARWAEPVGRGHMWPRRRPSDDHASSYSCSWCHGSAGFVSLFTLSYRLTRETSYLRLAEGAAWRTWEGAGRVGSLCCGWSGRAYALLNFWRASGDREWLIRARELAMRAATTRVFDTDYERSLYRGGSGLAALAADLERPEDAVHPLFEDEGWDGSGRALVR